MIMKKTTTFLIMAFAVMMLGFASCNKDKNKDNASVVTDLTEQVVGTYEGYTLAGSNFFSDMFTPDETFVIGKNSQNTVNVTFESKAWGSFTIEGATVTGSSAPYSISGSGVCKMGMGGQYKDYDCTFSAKIYGTDNDEISFEVPSVMGGTTVTFHKGSAPLGYYVKGSYSGEVSYSVAGANYDPFAASVTLKKGTGNSVTIVLPPVGEGMMSIPEMTVDNVEMTTTDYVVFNIAETEVEQTLNGVNFVGTLKGNVNGKTLTLNYSLKPGAMPMSIDFTFVGEK